MTSADDPTARILEGLYESERLGPEELSIYLRDLTEIIGDSKFPCLYKIIEEVLRIGTESLTNEALYQAHECIYFVHYSVNRCGSIEHEFTETFLGYLNCFIESRRDRDRSAGPPSGSPTSPVTDAAVNQTELSTGGLNERGSLLIDRDFFLFISDLISQKDFMQIWNRYPQKLTVFSSSILRLISQHVCLFNEQERLLCSGPAVDVQILRNGYLRLQIISISCTLLQRILKLSERVPDMIQGEACLSCITEQFKHFSDVEIRKSVLSLCKGVFHYLNLQGPSANPLKKIVRPMQKRRSAVLSVAKDPDISMGWLKEHRYIYLNNSVMTIETVGTGSCEEGAEEKTWVSTDSNRGSTLLNMFCLYFYSIKNELLMAAPYDSMHIKSGSCENSLILLFQKEEAVDVLSENLNISIDNTFGDLVEITVGFQSESVKSRVVETLSQLVEMWQQNENLARDNSGGNGSSSFDTCGSSSDDAPNPNPKQEEVEESPGHGSEEKADEATAAVKLDEATDLKHKKISYVSVRKQRSREEENQDGPSDSPYDSLTRQGQKEEAAEVPDENSLSIPDNQNNILNKSNLPNVNENGVDRAADKRSSGTINLGAKPKVSFASLKEVRNDYGTYVEDLTEGENDPRSTPGSALLDSMACQQLPSVPFSNLESNDSKRVSNNRSAASIEEGGQSVQRSVDSAASRNSNDHSRASLEATDGRGSEKLKVSAVQVANDILNINAKRKGIIDCLNSIDCYESQNVHIQEIPASDMPSEGVMTSNNLSVQNAMDGGSAIDERLRNHCRSPIEMAHLSPDLSKSAGYSDSVKVLQGLLSIPISPNELLEAEQDYLNATEPEDPSRNADQWSIHFNKKRKRVLTSEVREAEDRRGSLKTADSPYPLKRNKLNSVHMDLIQILQKEEDIESSVAEHLIMAHTLFQFSKRKIQIEMVTHYRDIRDEIMKVHGQINCEYQQELKELQSDYLIKFNSVQSKHSHFGPLTHPSLDLEVPKASVDVESLKTRIRELRNMYRIIKRTIKDKISDATIRIKYNESDIYSPSFTLDDVLTKQPSGRVSDSKLESGEMN